MKDGKKGYLILWGVVAAAFLLAALLIPERVGVWKKNASFWVAVFVALLLMAGNLFCTLRLFDAKTKEKLFLRLPAALFSYLAIGSTFAAEMVCIFVLGGKIWLGTVLGIAILVCYAAGVFGLQTAEKVIENTESKTEEKTEFIKKLRTEAQLLTKQTASGVGANEARRVEEALRYSDPCSDPRLDEVEGRLYVAYADFAEAVRKQEETCGEKAEKVLHILEERNAECKQLK